LVSYALYTTPIPAPGYGLSYLVLASLYNDAGRIDDALAVLPIAIRLLPSAWQSHFEMARALTGKKDYPTALREVTEALRLTPRSVSPQTQALAHYLRARILWKLTEFSGAKEEFEQTLKKDPDGELGVRSRRALEFFQSPHR
jgi:tetratricopeptide (TPR) repeat protein